MTDVVVQDLAADARVSLRCGALVRKVVRVRAPPGHPPPQLHAGVLAARAAAPTQIADA